MKLDIELNILRNNFIRRASAAAFLITFLQPLVGLAQTTVDIANCGELRTPDIVLQKEFCEANTACKFFLSKQASCKNAAALLVELRNILGKPEKKWSGWDKEITANALFESGLLEQSKKLNDDPDWKAEIGLIKDKVAKASNRTTLSADGMYSYIGDTVAGLPHGEGAMFVVNGTQARGTFRDGNFAGAGGVGKTDRQHFDGSRDIAYRAPFANGADAILGEYPIFGSDASGFQYIGTYPIDSTNMLGRL